MNCCIISQFVYFGMNGWFEYLEIFCMLIMKFFYDFLFVCIGNI